MSNQLDVPNLPSIDGKEVLEFGRVGRLSGAVPVHEMPDGASGVQQNLRFNDRVYVIKVLNRPSGWAMVATDDGCVGYVDKNTLFIGAPDPDAKLHYVKPGESAEQIAKQYYSNVIQPGRDARFYVNVMVYANWSNDGSERGISKQNLSDNWATTSTTANYYIWVPSPEFARTLEGRVSAGSIQRDTWNSVVRTFEAGWEWFKFGVGFVGGLLHGALECIWDMVVGLFDLVGMIWSFIKLIFTGQILKKAKELWASLTLDNLQAAASKMFADFSAKWNDPSSLKRGHFRGWVVGYLVATVLLTIFTLGGAALAMTGRIGALIKWMRSYKVLAQALDVAKASADRLSAGARRAREALRNSLRKPRKSKGKTPEHDKIDDELREAVGGDKTPADGKPGAGAVAAGGTPMAIVAGKAVKPTGFYGGFYGMTVEAGKDAKEMIQKIFKEGLPERGKNMDLDRHAKEMDVNSPVFEQRSAYRGTTQQPATMNGQGAAYWADEGGLVLEIKGVATWDVNAELAGRIKKLDGSFGGNLMHAELEHAILSLVPPERILRIGIVSESRTGRMFVKATDWVHNPNYVPK